jgi:hypothetical protein
MRKLPIGIQDFAKLREDGYVYVDKTDFVYKMAKNGGPYFLGRPRRFGKSLLCSTLEAYFLGRRDLFEECAGQPRLAIADLEHDWKVYPVIHLTMNSGSYTSIDNALRSLDAMVSGCEKQFNIVHGDAPVNFCFENLIAQVCEKTKERVVVIIDEYDKPLTDNIDNPEIYESIQRLLQDFYGVLKPSDKYLRFVFLTGVTKFSKVSIFSTLNQLRDISLEEEFAEVCGITETELVGNFHPEIEAIAKSEETNFDGMLDILRGNYNGYHFSKDVSRESSVYNPFSVINCLTKKDVGYYWFSTGTPTFLFKKLQDSGVRIRSLGDGVSTTPQAISDYRPENPDPIPLLYQSGYLTIKEYSRKLKRFTLAYPNSEVRNGFLYAFLPILLHNPPDDRGLYIGDFYNDLSNGDVDSFMTRITAFFASIPYGTVKEGEHYFQTVFYVVFTLLGEFCRTEVRSAAGRADMVVYAASAVYCFEFKLDGRGRADDALRQIDDKDYLIPYSASGKELVKLGVVFDSEKGTIGEWKRS